jgi:hypothetical protein
MLDENRLTKLCISTLFGLGKLSLEAFGCEREVQPLVVAHISTKPTMLLVENAVPFMVARSILSKPLQHESAVWDTVSRSN